MGDDDGGPAKYGVVDCILNQMLAFGVKGRLRLCRSRMRK